MENNWIIYFGKEETSATDVPDSWERLFKGLLKANKIENPWWKFDLFQTAKNSVDESFNFIKNKKSEISQMIGGGGGDLNIIVAGNILTPCLLDHFCALITGIESQKSEMFQGIHVKIYSFIQFPMTLADQNVNIQNRVYSFLVQLNTLMNIQGGFSPIDKLFVFHPSNRFNDNREGFYNLNEQEYNELLGQALLHFSLDNLNFLQKGANDLDIYSINSFALVYDVENHTDKALEILVEKCLKEFKNNDSQFDGYVSTENEVTSKIKTYGIVDKLNHLKLFKLISAKFSSESDKYKMNQKIWEKPKPGPYHIFWVDQLLLYFKQFIIFLPAHLVTYCKLFTTKSIAYLEEKLKIFEDEFITNKENNIFSMIDTCVVSPWSSNENYQGLKEHDRIVEKIKELSDEQKSELIILAEKHFVVEGKNLEVFHVPQKIRKTYNSLYKELINAPNDEIEKRQEKVIKKMHTTLKRHPVPLALLIRTILSGTVLALAGFIFLRFLPDFFIDTSYFEQDKVMPFTIFALFAFPFIFAIIRYVFMTVCRVQSCKKEYIALCLIAAQKEAHSRIKSTLESVFKNVYKYCEDLISKTGRIRDNLNIAGTNPAYFVETKFQKDITGEIAGEKILNNSIFYKCNIDGTKVKIEDVNVAQTKIVIYQMLQSASPDSSDLFWKQIYDEKTNIEEIKKYLSQFMITNNDSIGNIIVNCVLNDDVKNKIFESIYPACNIGAGNPILKHANTNGSHDLLEVLGRTYLDTQPCELTSIYSFISGITIGGFLNLNLGITLHSDSFKLSTEDESKLILFKVLLCGDDNLIKYKEIFGFDKTYFSKIKKNNITSLWNLIENSLFDNTLKADCVSTRLNNL